MSSPSFGSPSLGSTLDAFSASLLYWRNNFPVQDKYPANQFPSILHFPVPRLSITPSAIAGSSVVSFSSFMPSARSPAIQIPAGNSIDMDIDFPDDANLKAIDQFFDLSSLAASFGGDSLHEFMTSRLRTHLCPALLSILYDGQTITKALLSVCHGPWQDITRLDGTNRPSEADIAFIGFQTAFIMHQKLVELGLTGSLGPAERCPSNTIRTLQFLDHSFLNRSDQRVLSMVRDTFGKHMRDGWHSFGSHGGDTQTAQNCLDGVGKLVEELKLFVDNPSIAFSVDPTINPTPRPLHIALIAMYHEFYTQKWGGQDSMHLRLRNLRERWTPVWNTPGVSGYSWYVNGKKMPFNHQSLNIHNLPFLHYNPLEGLGVILAALQCILAEGRVNLQKLKPNTIISYNIFYARGSLRTPRRLDFFPFRVTCDRFLANCLSPGASSFRKNLQWELNMLLPNLGDPASESEG